MQHRGDRGLNLTGGGIVRDSVGDAALKVCVDFVVGGVLSNEREEIAPLRSGESPGESGLVQKLLIVGMNTPKKEIPRMNVGRQVTH